MFRRTLSVLFVGAAAALLLVLAWPQALGLQYAPVIAQAVSLRGTALLVGAVLAILFLIGALTIRRFRAVGAITVLLLVAFVAVNAAVLTDRGIGRAEDAGNEDATGNGDITGNENAAGNETDTDNETDSEPAPDGGLTVLAWNTLGDAPGAQAIADLALETGADIVSLPETTEDTAVEVATIMREAGRPMWVNTLALDEFLSARSTSLLTSADLGQYRRDDSRGTTSVVPSVVAVPVDGSGPTIIAAHPVAPIPGYLDQWQADLEWLAGVCTGTDIIMAGDLNSTIDHYARLGSASGGTIGDCVDAAASTGNGGVGTWPASAPALLGAPIDHVMSTPDRVATSSRVILDRDGAGSDHRPIVARLVPAG